MAKRTQKQDVSSKNMITIALIVAAAFLISGNNITGAIFGMERGFGGGGYVPPQPITLPTFPTAPPVSTSNGEIQEPIIIWPIEPTTTTSTSVTVTLTETWNGKIIYMDGTEISYTGTITVYSDGTVVIEKVFSDGGSIRITDKPDGSTEIIDKSPDGKYKTTTTTSTGKTTQY